MSKRLWRPGAVIAGIGVLTLIAIAGWYAYRANRNGAPDFTLTDQHNRPFVLSAQRGHRVVLFFGYTHCTDVCPQTLAAVERGVRKAGASGKDIEVAFVTVDPARDTPAALGKFATRFGDNVVGLTGSEAQLAPVYKAYHVFVQALPQHGHDEEISHDSAVYYIDATGRLRAYGEASDDVPTIAADLRKLAS